MTTDEDEENGRHTGSTEFVDDCSFLEEQKEIYASDLPILCSGHHVCAMEGVGYETSGDGSNVRVLNPRWNCRKLCIRWGMGEYRNEQKIADKDKN